MIQRMKRVHVFKDGYASDNTGYFDVPRDTPREEAERIAKATFGGWARIAHEAYLPTYDRYGAYVPEDREREALDKHGGDLIDRLYDTYFLTIAEAGPNWQHDDYLREDLDKLNKQIRKLYVEALQRVPKPFDTRKDNS